MPTVRFVGRILPPTVTANFPDSQKTSWGSDDLGFPIVMQARVRNSQVEVICEVAAFKDEHLSTLLARAYNLVDAYVDAAAFCTGVGMLTELYAVDVGDHKLLGIAREHAELKSLCTAYKIPAITPEEQRNFAEIVRLILAEPNLLGSMSDLAQTLMQFHVIPTNCGRVLDSLRRAVAPMQKREQGWKLLQQTINADADYLNWVSVYSTLPRHGDRETPIDKAINDEIRKRTWTVMNRLLEYRKGGSKTLDPIKFPTLVHDPAFPFSKL